MPPAGSTQDRDAPHSPEAPAGPSAETRALSYAQNMEDAHLALAFGGTTTGTYIDIGGGHPVAGSVSFWFYERGWRGLVVEPQQGLADLHRRLRPRDTLIQAVIGHDQETVDFHQVDRLHALSTTVKSHADAAAVHGASHRTLRVPSISLAELCRRHALTNFDFLKIDVEGAELAVIAGADWQRYRPAIVVVEAIAPVTNEPSWESWEPLLLAQGYRFALFDTLNRFYVGEEHSAVWERMPKSRAPWDSVRHMYEIGRAPENAGHPDHRLATELTRAFWARLPHLPDDLILSLLDDRGIGHGNGGSGMTEALRLSLGRIACGYDGGQLAEEPKRDPAP
jgi:FkbM family methyltransferase